MKDYIVSLNVSFTTPVDVKANSDKEAETKGIAEFKKKFEVMKKELNDSIDLEINLDYVEED